MKIGKTLLALFACASILPFGVNAKEGNAGKHLVLNLIGAGSMYEGMVPDIDGDGIDDPAICFDVNLVNAKNNNFIGTGTDCLSDIQPTGTGLSLIGTTIFNLPGGTLVTRGSTTVQPVLKQTITPTGQPITHITGAADSGNAVISGTGRFRNSTGTVRLSGMVDMSGFGGSVGDPIVFDCLFVVNID